MKLEELTAKYLGKPYESGSDGPLTFDCWGLVKCIVERDLGLEFGDIIEKDHLLRQGFWKEVCSYQFGDILLFNTLSGKHIALALNHKEMIHCDKYVGSVVVESYIGHLWKSRLIKGYRYQNLI